jgi:hypothetical protein
MKDQKSKVEIDVEKTKESIEKVTKKGFSNFFRFFWKSVDFGKKRGQ